MNPFICSVCGQADCGYCPGVNMKTRSIYELAGIRINEYEMKHSRSNPSDEPLDVRFARALFYEHLQLMATQKLLVDKTEEFNQLDEQCLAFIGEMMRQDRVIKVIEPIGWLAIAQRDVAQIALMKVLMERYR